MALDNQPPGLVLVEINEANSAVKERSFQKDGRNMTFRHQDAYLHLPEQPYPLPFRLGISENSAPHSPGIYAIDPVSFAVGRYGDLEINRSNLKLRRIDLSKKIQAA